MRTESDKKITLAYMLQKRRRRRRLSWLENDDNLQRVFQLVGRDEHYFVASTCKRWRERYMVCARWAMATSYKAAVVTLSRLESVLEHGLTLEQLQAPEGNDRPTSLAIDILDGLQPIQVLTFLRVRGTSWDTAFTTQAAVKEDMQTLN